MSAYISDTTLTLCLDLLCHQHQICRSLGFENVDWLLSAMDEVTAGISGISIEKARELREQAEAKIQQALIDAIRGEEK